MDTGIGSGLLEIATGLLGIALIALLVGNASKTVQVIDAGTTGFNQLLRTVTLQNGSGFNITGMGSFQ